MSFADSWVNFRNSFYEGVGIDTSKPASQQVGEGLASLAKDAFSGSPGPNGSTPVGYDPDADVGAAPRVPGEVGSVAAAFSDVSPLVYVGAALLIYMILKGK